MLQGLGGGRFTNASGIIDPNGMPRIIGRGLAAADFANDGRMAIAINTIGGPLVLLQDTGPVGHWLEVSLKGFQAGAVLTATLPNGRKLVQELHAGSSYLSSADPRAHFGLGGATKVARLTIRWPDGRCRTSRTSPPTGSSRSRRPGTDTRGSIPSLRYSDPELSTIWAISTNSIVGSTPYRPATRSRSSSEKKSTAASFDSQT